MIKCLSEVIHYPIGGKEFTAVFHGLLGKYRSMVLELQNDLFLLNQSNELLKANFHHSTNENILLNKIKNDEKKENDKKKMDVSTGTFIEEHKPRIPTDEDNEKHSQISRGDKNLRNENPNYHDDDSSNSDNNHNNKNNSGRDINIQMIYEKLFLEMDEKSRKEYEYKITQKNIEFNKILEFKEFEVNDIMKNKELYFQEQYSALQLECDTANEDRLKLFEISELLHVSYTKLKNENEMLSRDILQSGEFVCLYVCLSVCPSFCLSVYLCVFLSGCLPVCLPVCMNIYLYIYTCL